jgi:hypothetical protein
MWQPRKVAPERETPQHGRVSGRHDALRCAWSLLVVSCVACSTEDLLGVELPADDSPTTLVIARRGESVEAFAFEGAPPSPLPGLRISDAPLELTVLGMDTPLIDLGLAGAPGALTVVSPASAGVPLGPAQRAWARTITVDDAGAWASASAADTGLRAAEAPACRPLVARDVPLPPGAEPRALYTRDEESATLITEDAQKRSQWHRVRAGVAEPGPDELPGLSVRAGAFGPDGAEWIAGFREGIGPELWRRLPGATFVRVPDSPGMAAGGEDAEVRWISAFDGGLWVIDRVGIVERYRGDAWDRYIAPAEPIPSRVFASIAARGADDVAVILPFTFDGGEPRHLVHVRGSTVTSIELGDVYPHTVSWIEALDSYIVGSEVGQIYRLGPQQLTDVALGVMGSKVFAVRQAVHGRWRGVLYVGLNGFLREYYEGAGYCLTSKGLTFNAADLVNVGPAWVASGWAQPPSRRPLVSWIER